MQNRLALGFTFVTVLIDHIGIAISFPIMPDLMRELTHTDLAAASLWGGVLAMRPAPMAMTGVFWAFTHEGAAIDLPGAPFLLPAVLMIPSIAMFATPAAGAGFDCQLRAGMVRLRQIMSRIVMPLRCFH